MKRFTTCSISLFVLFLLATTACKKDKILDRDKFLGSYNTTENCTPGQSFFMTVSASATSEDEVVIFNFGNFDNSVTGKVSGNNITIPTQTFNFNAGGAALIIMVSGAGSITDKTMTINYTWTETTMGGNATCEMTSVQQ